jgi:hypothetical protein
VTKTVERTFGRGPRELVEGMLSPEYLTARSAALGGTGPATVERDGDVVVVRFPRRIPLDDVPGPLRALAGSGDVVQVERWTRIADDGCAATWETESAMPGRVTGTFEVVPAPGGATYRVVATAKVNVPLVGGRIAGDVEGHVARLVESEMDFAEEWLARQ